MRSRFEEAKRRAALRREEERLDALERRAAQGDGERASILDIMGAADVEPGLERGDGYFVAHEVRATEPWRPSQVQLDERPRVASAKVRGKRCERCGRVMGRADTRQRFHARGTACAKARATAQRAAHRAKVAAA